MEIIFWLWVWFLMTFVVKNIWEGISIIIESLNETNEPKNETEEYIVYNILLNPNKSNLKVIKDYINSSDLNYIERITYESISKKKTLFHLIVNESQYNLLLKFINDNNLSNVKIDIVEKLTNIKK